jgi:tetratricopeptide (TPR) repeat protein
LTILEASYLIDPMRRLAVTAAFAAGVLFLLPARAQQPDNAARAEALFREGRAALDRGEPEAACGLFEQSLQAYESAGALLNFADCEERRGHLVAARQYWIRGLDKLNADDERVVFAKKRLAACEAMTPHLKITLGDKAPADATVECDGKPIPPAEVGAPRVLDPGAHTVVVRSSQQPEQRLTVTLSQGQNKELVVTATVQEVVHEPTPVPSGAGPLRPVAYGFFGVAGVGALAAIVTGILVVTNDATIKSDCPNKTCLKVDGNSAISRGNAFIAANTVSVIVTGVAAGAGATFWWLSRPQAATAPQVTGAVGPGFGFLGVKGRF